MKIKTLNDIPAVAAYLRRIGAEARSLRSAVVRGGSQAGGYFHETEIATIIFSHKGVKTAPMEYAPTSAEIAAIEKEMEGVEWPKAVLAPNGSKPDELNGVSDEALFYYFTESGDLSMIQHRIENIKNGKYYIPYTYWDDGIWRKGEPDGPLPLWGLPQLGKYTTVFLHEGAKAARYCAWMVEGATAEARQALADHPWGEKLQAAAHLGWQGGAPAGASRADWTPLVGKGITIVYIVSDNDKAGVEAVPTIAYNVRVPTYHIQFTENWTPGFDLADPFPAEMFSMIGGTRHYTGPAFRECMHPATWATDLRANPQGKPTPVLRDSFADLWAYVEEADLFVCVEMPEIQRTDVIINKMLSAFSHSNRTGDLIIKHYHGRNVRLCYRPDISGRIVTDRQTSAVNLRWLAPSTIQHCFRRSNLLIWRRRYIIHDSNKSFDGLLGILPCQLPSNLCFKPSNQAWRWFQIQLERATIRARHDKRHVWIILTFCDHVPSPSYKKVANIALFAPKGKRGIMQHEA